MPIVERSDITTSILGPYGIFTSSWIDVELYPESYINIITDIDSDTSGCVYQHSTDSSSIDFTNEQSVNSPGSNIYVTHLAKYFRIIYTNGSIAQTRFRIQLQHSDELTITNPTTDSTVYLDESINQNSTNISNIQNNISNIQADISNIQTDISNIDISITTLEDASGTTTSGYDDSELRTIITNNSTTLDNVSWVVFQAGRNECF